MNTNSEIHTSLINVKDSCLVVIDVQKIFLEKLPDGESEDLIRRIIWLVNVATRLGVPLIVTAEDIPENGSIIPELERLLPANTDIHNKMIFGLAADEQIVNAMDETHRKIPILIGLETDVCVAQSAIGLLGLGYQVVVVEDACSSPGLAHGMGLKRMENAGVMISNVKSLFYEWLRTVEYALSFLKQYKDEIGSPGIQL